MHISISGVVITQAPAHQTAPSDTRDGNVAWQIKMPVMRPDGSQEAVPYITANSVRGLLRRHAADVLFERLSEVSAPAALSRKTYLSVVRGAYAASGGIHTERLTVTAAASARKHVFARLFGGGAYMLEGALKLESPLLPVVIGRTAHLMPASVAGYAVELDPQARLTTVERLYARDDLQDLPESAVAVIGDLETEYAAHMAEKLAEREGKKLDKARARQAALARRAQSTATVASASGQSDDEPDTDVADGAADAPSGPRKKQTLDNLFDTECIPAGLPLAFRARADRIEEAHAGLLLLALERWARQNALGSGSARGRGSFRPRLSLRISTHAGSPVEEVDSLFLNEDDPAMVCLDRGNRTIQRLLQACETALELDASAQALREVYPVDFIKPEEAKAGKVGRGKGKKTAQSEQSSEPA